MLTETKSKNDIFHRSLKIMAKVSQIKEKCRCSKAGKVIKKEKRKCVIDAENPHPNLEPVCGP